jgi:phosphoglycolate phosphatase
MVLKNVRCKIMKYNCIIWDWNGTLFDDMDVSISVMNRVLSNRGLPLLDNKRYKEIFGFPVQQYYLQLGIDLVNETFEKISTEFITEYQKESFSAKLTENSIPTLEYIRKQGIRQVILSASKTEYLEEQVKYFGIIDYFDRLLGLNHYHATSKVDVGKRWLEESRYDKREVLLIGDTIHDYETASEIGCDCLLFANGHQGTPRLSGLGVPVIMSLEEVKKYL